MAEIDEKKRTIDMLEEINRRLGVLLGERIRENNDSVKDQVKRLVDAGFGSASISEILGISRTHASTVASAIRKRT